MSFVEVPIQPLPNATFLAQLDNDTAQITVHTTDDGLFADVVYNGTPIATGRLCLDRVNINASHYRGLSGGLYFVDLRGSSDPVYSGFGSRYRLYYGDPDATPSTGITTSPANPGSGTWTPPPGAPLIVTETGTILATEDGQPFKVY